MKKENLERREIVKKAWLIPTFMVLGSLTAEAVPGGSSVGVGNGFDNPACSGKNPPGFCSN